MNRKTCIVLVNHFCTLAGEGMDSASEPGTQTTTPQFVKEPEPYYYIVKNKPVTITCQAKYAAEIVFKCAEEWVPDKQHVRADFTDSDTGEKLVQASVVVSRQNVDEYFGLEGYWCECVAYPELPFGPDGVAKDAPPASPATSRRGRVQTACKYTKNSLKLVIAIKDFVYQLYISYSQRHSFKKSPNKPKF